MKAFYVLLLAGWHSIAAAQQLPPPAVTVNQAAVQLSIEQFTPVIENWGSRKVVVGYEAFLDVKASEGKSTLLFKAQSEVAGRWFSANFAMTAKLSCSGIPVGMMKMYGKRVGNESTPAQGQLLEVRHQLDQCQQVRIYLAKEGNLSRQFYTKIEKIDFSLKIYAETV
jgi:hypothetical protein